MNKWQYNDANFNGVIVKNNLEKKIKNIVLVGPHASGKTYMFNQLKSSLNKTKFSFPKRLTSRPIRLNDDEQENEFTNKQKVCSENNLIIWKRSTTDAEDEYYAFEKANNNKIAVLSANNGILESIHELGSPVNTTNSLIICVYAPLEVRQRGWSQQLASPPATRRG